MAAATLSNRYITDRFLPDKAIDLVDEAASGCVSRSTACPPRSTRSSAGSCSLQIEREALKQGERRRHHASGLQTLEKELAELKKRYDELRKHVGEGEGSHHCDPRHQGEDRDRPAQNASEAEREGDLGKAAEIRYGKLVALEKELGRQSKGLPRCRPAAEAC